MHTSRKTTRSGAAPAPDAADRFGGVHDDARSHETMMAVAVLYRGIKCQEITNAETAGRRSRAVLSFSIEIISRACMS